MSVEHFNPKDTGVTVTSSNEKVSNRNPEKAIRRDIEATASSTAEQSAPSDNTKVEKTPSIGFLSLG